MEAIVAYTHDIPARLRRRLRFDLWTEVRPAEWSRHWSYEAARGARGDWTVELWAWRCYLVFGRLPRHAVSP